MVDLADTSPVKEGEVLADKYRVDKLLGVGGMGVVVAATHIQLGKKVAIKFMLPAAVTMPVAMERFVREARAAVQLRGEHVAQVVDVGTLKNGAPYMVMDYLDGNDLGFLIQQHGALPIADAVDFVLQACEAVAEAHSAGIVHRDLKPRNLFVTKRVDQSPLVKVLDFGISKVMNVDGKEDHALTGTNDVMGSPLYMSPEQLKSSRHVDGRTDIWSLGVVLYELLTGQVPFRADTIPQLCGLVLQEPPTPLVEHRPDAPYALWLVILRCLAKDPAGRFQNVDELAKALEPFAPHRSRQAIERIQSIVKPLDALSATAPMPATSSARALGPTPSTNPSWADSMQPVDAPGSRSKSRVSRVVVAAVLAGAALMATFAWFSRSRAVTPTSNLEGASRAAMTVERANAVGAAPTASMPMPFATAIASASASAAALPLASSPSSALPSLPSVAPTGSARSSNSSRRIDAHRPGVASAVAEVGAAAPPPPSSSAPVPRREDALMPFDRK